MLLTWVLSLLGCAGFFGGIIVAANSKSPEWGVALLLGGFAMFIAAVIVANAMARVLVPKKIDERYAWYGGAGEAFLRTLIPIA